jgi:hypothetical protein
MAASPPDGTAFATAIGAEMGFSEAGKVYAAQAYVENAVQSKTVELV